MNKISRDTSIMIRGVAALLVIIAHYSQWYATATDAGIVCMLLTKLGRYGVSIFFAVSGYGLLCSAERGIDRDFLKRRVLSVYLPYVLIFGIINFLEEGSWKIKDIILWLCGLKAWFIFVIMLFYFIFYFGYKYCKHKMLSIVIGVFTVSSLLSYCTKDDVWYASNISFVVGMFIKLYEDKIAEFSKFIFTGISMGGFIGNALIYMMAMNQNQIIYIFFKILASALWATLILGILIQFKIRKVQGLEVIGSVSLECYLLHGFILSLFKPLSLQPIFLCGISVMVTLVCAYAVHNVITKIIKLIRV